MMQAEGSARWRKIAVWSFLGLFSLHAVADDQADRIKALEKRLESSVRLIEELSSRITELERNAKAAAPAVAASEPAPSRSLAASPAPSLTSLQDQVDQINEGLSQREFDAGLPLHGFADVKAASASAQDPLRLRGFDAGTLDFYLTPQFGNRIRSLVEIALEYDPHGTGSTADMERLQLGYTLSDALTLWMGRFHTPFGLWNTSFHHGANLQTSIYRPQFIEFEDRGGIIPAHSIGIWGSGRTEVGPGKVTYDAYLSNGPSIRDRQLDFNPFTDDSVGKMVGFNLGYQPSGPLRGWTAGLHGFASTVGEYTPSDVLFTSTRLRMAGAYANYEANDWEVFAEYYGFSDINEASPTRHRSNVGFVHVGKSFGSLTPYVRYERASVDPLDDYFIAQRTGRSYTRAVVGARYALDAKSSIKLELSHTDSNALNQRDEDGGIVFAPAASYHRATFQYSIAF